jgi:hypothetical protein
MHLKENARKTSTCSSLNLHQVHRHEQECNACKPGFKSADFPSDLNGITFKTTSEMTQSNYAKLVGIAANLLKYDRLRFTIEPNELVHEVYVVLREPGEKVWASEAHFVGTYVRVMRHWVWDLARALAAQKRGGGLLHVQIGENL